MQVLEFKRITRDMRVLYKRDVEIFATKVVSTSLGHPGIQTVRLEGGFTLNYLTMFELTYDKPPIELYDDSPVNRTELLLENQMILTNLLED